MLNTKALYNLSYGLYVIGSKKGSRLNGQIANTVFQISSKPMTIAISLNKKNLTNEYVRESKAFVVSVLSQDAPLSLIGQFGFKSGRDTDKFQGIKYLLSQGGIPYLVDNNLAYMGARVINEIDALTHTVFIGEVTEAEVLKEGTPMTYAYYQQVKKGGVHQNAPTYVKSQTEAAATEEAGKFVCSVCGYTYDSEMGDPDNGIPAGTPFEKLPDNWVCPVCGAAKSEFKEVQPIEKASRSLKGTKTEKNVLKAFAGESQARNLYTYFASQAKKEGYEKVSAIFIEAAENEKEHAKRFLSFLHGGEVKVEETYHPVVVKDVKENLRAAAEGENHEHTKVYPEAAQLADKEGFPEIAQTFRAIAVAEKQHEKRYRAILVKIEKETTFKNEEVIKWKCRNCGYIHEGTKAPEKCPACLHPKSYFEKLAENY